MSCYYSTTINSKNIQFLHRAIIAKGLNDNDNINKLKSLDSLDKLFIMK